MACCLPAPCHYLKPILTSHWDSVAFAWGHFHSESPSYYFVKQVWKYSNNFKIIAISPGLKGHCTQYFGNNNDRFGADFELHKKTPHISVWWVGCAGSVWYQGHLLPTWLTLILAWIKIHMPSTVWDEITYFSQTSTAAPWLSNFILH